MIGIHVSDFCQKSTMCLCVAPEPADGLRCLRKPGHAGYHEHGDWTWSDPVETFVGDQVNTRRSVMMNKRAMEIGFGPGSVESALRGSERPHFVRAYVDGGQVLVES